MLGKPLRFGGVFQGRSVERITNSPIIAFVPGAALVADYPGKVNLAFKVSVALRRVELEFAGFPYPVSAASLS